MEQQNKTKGKQAMKVGQNASPSKDGTLAEDTGIWQVIRTQVVAGMQFKEVLTESGLMEAMLGQCEIWSSKNADLNVSYKVILK